MVDRHSHRRHPPQVGGFHGKGFTPQAHPSHIPEAHHAAVGRVAQDQILEVFRVAQSALQHHGEGELLAGGRWGATDLPHRHQAILAAQGLHHIAGGELVGGEAHRIEPEAKGQLAITEILQFAHPRHPADSIGEILIQQAADGFEAVELIGIFAGKIIYEQDRI